MSLDMLLCTPGATFGQPEITLGIIPGAGGTQRLTGLIGKPRAMEMVLANRKIDGKTAEAWGLVSRCVAEGEDVVAEAVKIGDRIAGYGAVAVQAGKEAVNGCESTSRRYGVELTSSARVAPGAGSQVGEEAVPESLCDQGSEGG
jgi:enoyl-CoA hydratase